MKDRTETYGRGDLQWVKDGPGECVARLNLELPRGADGKRRRKSYTLKGSKREIEKERTRLLAALHEGQITPSATQTVAQYLEYWLRNAVKNRLGERTAVNYAQYCQYYIVPRLGHLRLDALTPTIVQAFYTELLETGRCKKRAGGPTGLSATTVNNLHRVFHEAMKWAVKWRMLPANPTDNLAVAKPDERKPLTLTREQVAVVMDAATDWKVRLLVMIGVCTGLRRGEILGLRWADVNLETGIMSIQNTWVDTGERLIFKPPKTDAGKRPIKMPSILVEVLAEHRDIQQQHKDTLGEGYQDHDLVLCWEDGTPINPHRFYRPLKNLLRRLGLPQGVRLHDLKHSHATHLLQDGVHPKTVSERLGHKDVETTLNIYSHVLPHIQQEAAETTDKGMREVMRRPGSDAVSE